MQFHVLKLNIIKPLSPLGLMEKSTGVLGTGDATEMDESSVKFQMGGGGGVNFQSKTLLNFGP